MDYQYINTVVGETYQDLHDSGNKFPEYCEKSLIKYCTDDLAIRQGAVSEIYTYFTESNGSDIPVIVFSKLEKACHTSSVGRCVQCAGWSWNGRLLKNNFAENVLGTGFYDEAELIKYSEAKTAVPLMASQNRIKAVPADKQAIKAVLYAVVVRWLMGGNKISIAVPSGADYSEYVLGAVNTIYSYFPVGMRAEAGFCSYMTRTDIRSREKNRIYIAFVPEAEADTDTIFLDGTTATSAINNILERKSGLKKLDKFVEFICSLDDEKRRRLIDSIYSDVEGNGSIKDFYSLQVTKYGNLVEAITLLEADGEIGELLPLWNAFYAEPEKYPASMTDSIREKIHLLLGPDDFKAFLLGQLSGCADISQALVVYQSIDGICHDHLNNSCLDVARDLLIDFLKSKLEQSPSDLYASLKAHRDEFGIFVTDEMLSSAGVDKCASLFENIKTEYDRNPPRNSEEYSLIKEQISRLKDACCNLPRTEKLDNFIKTLGIYLQELDTGDNAKRLRLAEDRKNVTDSSNYFKYIENLRRYAADHPDDTDGIAKLKDGLLQRRAPDIWAYKAQFEEIKGVKFDLEGIAGFPELLQQIAEDVLSFRNILCVSPDGPVKAEDFLSKIEGIEALAAILSKDHRVEVSLLNNHGTAQWAKNIISLSLDESSGSSDVKLLYDLIDAGWFQGKDMCRISEMLANCKAEKVSPLFDRILQGKFKNGTPGDYILAYESLCRNISDNPQEALGKLEARYDKLDKRNIDRIAKDSFRSFCSARRKTENKGLNKAAIISMAATGVVVVALLSGIAIFAVKNHALNVQLDASLVSAAELQAEYAHLTEQQATTDQDVPLENSAQTVNDNKVDKYLNLFDTLLSHSENENWLKAVYTDYKNGQKSYTGSDAGVPWEAAFFWECVYSSNSDGLIVLNSDGPAIKARVDAILDAFYAPIPEISAEENSETAPAEEIPAEGEVVPVEEVPAEDEAVLAEEVPAEGEPIPTKEVPAGGEAAPIEGDPVEGEEADDLQPELSIPLMEEIRSMKDKIIEIVKSGHFNS